MRKTIKLKARVVFEWEFIVSPDWYYVEGKDLDDVTVSDIIELEKKSMLDNAHEVVEFCDTMPSIDIIEVKD